MMTIADIRTATAPILRRYEIQRAYLFGSVARGEATRHSDIDMIALKQTSERFLDRTKGILQELNDAILDSSVELLIYTPEEYERMRTEPFISKAERESVMLYERL
jgi:predicted nucleotidyltransferase